MMCVCVCKDTDDDDDVCVCDGCTRCVVCVKDAQDTHIFNDICWYLIQTHKHTHIYRTDANNNTPSSSTLQHTYPHTNLRVCTYAFIPRRCGEHACEDEPAARGAGVLHHHSGNLLFGCFALYFTIILVTLFFCCFALYVTIIQVGTGSVP
jgi:hypothetical protein